MIKMVFEITDGYHEPDFYFEDGNVLNGYEEFINFLCMPHSDTFIFRRISREDFDEDSEEDIFLDSFVRGEYEQRIEKFHVLVELYAKTYVED